MSTPAPRERKLAMSPVAFVAALCVYVVLGVYFKSFVLNWLVGPLFPVLVLYLLPKGLRRMRRSLGRAR